MRCPVCRAETTGPACRRCMADLSLLVTTEAQRQQLLGEYHRAVQRRDWSRAEAALDQAEECQAGSDLVPLRAVLHLLQRDFPAAWRAYQCAQASGTTS